MTAEFQAASDSTGQIRLPRQLRRQQLVYSALRVFSNQGYHVTTMNHIASAADVTKPVLYQHFKSKRDLYLAVLDEQIDEMVKQVVTPSMPQSLTGPGLRAPSVLSLNFAAPALRATG